MEPKRTCRNGTDWLIDLVIRSLIGLFAIALLGIFGALLLGGLSHSIRQWGWVAGALLAAIGYPLGWVTFPGLRYRKLSQAELDEEDRRVRKPMSRIGGCLGGMLFGAFLGILVWFVTVVFWVSFALSPMSPDSWREGIWTTWCFITLPPWTAFAILGWTAGALALLGGTAGLCGKMYRYS